MPGPGFQPRSDSIIFSPDENAPKPRYQVTGAPIRSLGQGAQGPGTALFPEDEQGACFPTLYRAGKKTSAVSWVRRDALFLLASLLLGQPGVAPCLDWPPPGGVFTPSGCRGSWLVNVLALCGQALLRKRGLRSWKPQTRSGGIWSGRVRPGDRQRTSAGGTGPEFQKQDLNLAPRFHLRVTVKRPGDVPGPRRRRGPALPPGRPHSLLGSGGF